MNIGIKSIDKRLDFLERRISVDTEPDALSKLVADMKKVENENKKTQMRQILSHYEEDIVMFFPEGLTDTDLVKLLLFTIRYVESNHQTVSKTVGIKSSSEYKKSLCISLVKHIMDFSDDLISCSITPLVELLFAHPPSDVPVTSLKRKTTFFRRK